MTEAGIHDLLAPLEPVTIRRLFGGRGIYKDGRMFALAGDGELFLKVDEETVAEFRAAGSTPFIYHGGKKPIEMSYWRLPSEGYDDSAVLERFAVLALGAAGRAKPPKKRKAAAKRKEQT